MIGWIILGIILVILIIILLIPVGVDFRYEEEIIRFSLKIDGMNIQLIPKKKREPQEEKPKKEKKERKPKEEKPEKEGKKKKHALSLNLEEILELLKSLLNGLGRFSRKISVDRFIFHWIEPMWWDPYVSARIFAVVNAGMSELSPICVERFHCKESSVWTDIDFSREDMFLEFGLTMTIRIGQIVASLLIIAFGALRILLRSKRRVRREAKEEDKALKAWLKEHKEELSLVSAFF